MTTNRIELWLLVAIAILGLVVIASMATVPMTQPVGEYTHPMTVDADQWATWMEARMTDHMGPGSVAWMESHMGATIDQMAQYMAGSGPRPGGMIGPGYGC